MQAVHAVLVFVSLCLLLAVDCRHSMNNNLQSLQVSDSVSRNHEQDYVGMESNVDENKDRDYSRSENAKELGGIANAKDGVEAERAAAERKAAESFEKASAEAIAKEAQAQAEARMRREEAARLERQRQEQERRERAARLFTAQKKYYADLRRIREVENKKIEARNNDITDRILRVFPFLRFLISQTLGNSRGQTVRVKVHKKSDRIIVPFRGVLSRKGNQQYWTFNPGSNGALISSMTKQDGTSTKSDYKWAFDSKDLPSISHPYRGVYPHGPLPGPLDLQDDEEGDIGPVPMTEWPSTLREPPCPCVNMPHCPCTAGMWYAGPWGDCSTLCGPGNRTRLVRCLVKGRPAKGESDCLGVKPETKSLCNIRACTSIDTNFTIVSDWSMDWAVAKCPNRTMIITGGCIASSGDAFFQRSSPTRDSRGWSCGGFKGNRTAVAVCGIPVGKTCQWNTAIGPTSWNALRCLPGFGYCFPPDCAEGMRSVVVVTISKGRRQGLPCISTSGRSPFVLFDIDFSVCVWRGSSRAQACLFFVLQPSPRLC